MSPSRHAPGAPRHSYALRPGADRAALTLVVSAALDVLAPVLATAWIDEPPLGSVPAEAAGALERLRAAARAQVQEGRLPRTDGPHLGVDVDVSDPGQASAFAELAAWTTAGEAYTADEDEVVRAGDTGGSLVLSLTDQEHTALLQRLPATAAGLLEPR
ncbi:hypothetical protein [Motilibacter aurantiacus]|uniref:hypothetical protein n=1 Tax=Motilibacter aurantiacus TaxID=2714955 RepID=UPI00140A40F1|nr:hypothetical protein [Motilibacter aurantiacus]NHC46298.1 hypothetical protein [Motilibacter aurantiacus]